MKNKSVKVSAKENSGKRHFEAAIPLLALLAPYFNLLASDNYDFLAPESLIVGGLIVALGLGMGFWILRSSNKMSAVLVALFVVMFIDFQIYGYWAHHYIQHLLINPMLVVAGTWLVLRFRKGAGTILLAIFGMITASTLITYAFTSEDGANSKVAVETAHQGAESELPILIHIIMDEHAGIDALMALEGAGPEIAQETISFYQDNDFTLYNGAYSQYFETSISLGHAFNLQTNVDQAIVAAAKETKRYDLSRNEYFDRLQEMGFELNIYSNDYINLCNPGEIEGINCFPYKYKDLSVLRQFPMSTYDRSVVIGNVYLSFVNYFIWFKELFRIILNVGDDDDPKQETAEQVRGFKTLTFHFPFPLTGMQQFNILLARLDTAKPGEAFIMHILHPHFPYMLNADCSVLPMSEWGMYRFSGNPYNSNSPFGRKIKYENYVEQLSCINTMMGSLMDKLDEIGLKRRAVIILHGDHGSRITLRDPIYSEFEKMSDADYLDDFSTLFAVRLPVEENSVFDKKVPLTYLLKNLVENEFKTWPVPDLYDGPQSVYMRGLIGITFEAVPYLSKAEDTVSAPDQD